MLTYLAPDLLTRLRIEEFDAFAATFGETVEGIEVVPEGGGLRMNSRFAKFYNMPELLRILHQVADIKTAEDLQLPVPQLKQREDGQRAPRTVVVPASDGLSSYLAALVGRADAVRKGTVEPTADNLLKITHNGRSAAMDLRLVPPTADEIAAVLRQHDVLDHEDALMLLAQSVAEVWSRHRPNPLQPQTVTWPAELREQEGRMLWPGRFDPAVAAALLALADNHDRATGPFAREHMLDVLVNHDGLADEQVREQVAAYLLDQWAIEAPNPQRYNTFQWPTQVDDSDGRTIWRGALPASLRWHLFNAYRTANDDRPLTAAQLADLMHAYDNLDDPAVREHLATRLADLWQHQPPNPDPAHRDLDSRIAETAWPEALHAPPRTLWTPPFNAEVEAALLQIRGLDPAEPNKIAVVADEVARIYADNRDDIFLDPDGHPHPRRGAVQIVFSDLGVPAAGWNAYDEPRDQLAARGVPRAQIRFMHEASNDTEKAQLFAAARDGRISVLVGSTEKMGVGTNVQARAVALHHLDCPWRPADIQQREGRILRQGNQNSEVDIIRYVTEGSFDGFMWQTVARKAQFIAQVMRGRLDIREIEDVGDAALSYHEVKALATGNPLLLDQAALQAEVTKLERLERSHHRERDRLRWTRRQREHDITILHAEIDEALAAQSRRIDTAADKFQITVGDKQANDRKTGHRLLRDTLLDLAKPPARPQQHIATIGGFAVIAETRWVEAKNARLLYIDMPDIPNAHFSLTPDELDNADLVGRLEKRLRGLDAIVAQRRRDLDNTEQDLARITNNLNAPFRHAEALSGARRRLEDVNEQIAEAGKTEPQADTASQQTQSPEPAKRHTDPAIIRPGRPGHPDGNDTDEVLTIAIAAIDTFGLVSRRDAEASNGSLVPTAAIVDTALNGEGYDASSLREQLRTLVTGDTHATAAAVRTYALSLVERDTSDFAYELRQAAASDRVQQRHFATLVSAVNSYHRYQEDQAIQQSTAKSTWQGNRGDRLAIDALVLASRTYTRNQNGAQTATTTLYLSDIAGNLYLWRAPNLNAYRPGRFVRVTGTIKGHDTTDGHHHTELTRCAAAPIAPPSSWTEAAEPLPREGPGHRDGNRAERVRPDQIRRDSDHLSQPAPANLPSSAPVTTPETGAYVNVGQREANLRRHQIRMAIEEHAANFHAATGNAVRQIARLVKASPDEANWINTCVLSHPHVLDLTYRTPAQWDEIRTERGRLALAHAREAITARQDVAALDHLDHAHACGVLTEAEWRSNLRHVQGRHPLPPPTNLATQQSVPSWDRAGRSTALPHGETTALPHTHPDDDRVESAEPRIRPSSPTVGPQAWQRQASRLPRPPCRRRKPNGHPRSPTAPSHSTYTRGEP